MIIAIIGQSGFLAKSIMRFAADNHSNVKFPKFNRSDFFDKDKLDNLVRKSQTIILLSAVCRGLPDDEIYNVNMSYVDLLIESMERLKVRRTIVFPSSVQENDKTGYGRSKKNGKEKLALWCSKNDCNFLGLILPNIFGPEAKPNYASFIATFCYQLNSGNEPQILVDRPVQLLYVKHFVNELFYILMHNYFSDSLYVNPNFEYKVSDVLAKLIYFKKCMDIKKDVEFDSMFDLYLYETFKSYE